MAGHSVSQKGLSRRGGGLYPLLRTYRVTARNPPQWAAGIALPALQMKTRRLGEVGVSSKTRAKMEPSVSDFSDNSFDSS